MPLIHCNSLDDPRLDAYARLTDIQLRSRLEPEKGIFIAESEKVIGRALSAGAHMLSALCEKRHLAKLTQTIREASGADGCTEADIPIFVLEHEQLEHLTGFEVTRGTMAAFKRPQVVDPEVLISQAKRIAILDGITNHTNVGAIFRSAAALGIDAVLVSSDCYDPLYRRALRVSMGTVMQVPWTRIGTPEQPWTDTCMPLLHRYGFTVAAMALSDDSIPLGAEEIRACEKLALVFGTEGDGLSQRAIDACDITVRIPMAHGVDSLNVAASSAVAFWETRLQRN